MLFTVGSQAHQARLDGFVLFADADVTAYILGSSVVVVRRRRRWRKGLGVAVEGSIAGASYASWRRPFVVIDLALRTEV